jgi:Zn-dependent protease with chaperone function
VSHLRGTLYDGRTSRPVAVVVNLLDSRRVRVKMPAGVRELDLDELSISPRIGNTPRRLALRDGSNIEIDDNDSLDAWLARYDSSGWQHFVFRLERRWQYALASACLAILATVAFVVYGVPALAGWTARMMPASVDQLLGRGSLDVLDRLWFADSGLPEERQRELHARFDAMRREIPGGSEFRLELRRGAAIGANALALPAGVIVMTDELVDRAEHDAEIEAVLAHEIGHLVHRHTLRMMLQSSVSALLMLAIFGDSSSVSDLIVGVPTLLLQSGYSRDFEREADAYARDWLREHEIAGDPLGALLLRLGKERGDDAAPGYFASHPSARERALRDVRDPD